MKTNRLLIIMALLLSLAAAACLLFRYNVCNIRGVEPSCLYRQWEHVDGVQATFIHNYPVNDTVSIDVTLLQATDPAGWDTICTFFKYKPFEESLAAMTRGIDVLALLIGETRHECGMKDEEFAVVSSLKKYICIFHNTDQNYKNRIAMALFDKIFNSLKYKQNFQDNEKDN